MATGVRIDFKAVRIGSLPVRGRNRAPHWMIQIHATLLSCQKLKLKHPAGTASVPTRLRSPRNLETQGTYLLIGIELFYGNSETPGALLHLLCFPIILYSCRQIH